MSKMKLLLYCTKGNRYDKLLVNNKDLNCIFLNQSKAFYYDDCERFKHLQILNGKIIGECDYELEEIRLVDHTDWWDFETGTMYENELCRKSCLDNDELTDYLIAYGKVVKHYGYAIHIKNLHIFDEPKELNEYKQYKLTRIFEWYDHFPLEKAPQNMMYVYDGDEKKVLTSIRPEWLVKILNGEKTIEIRKKVLKEMLK